MALRRSLRRLARPWGPLGKPPTDARLMAAQRTEVDMTRMFKHPASYASQRDRYKLPVRLSQMHAIPRDLGELPRNWVMKILSYNEPILLSSLWDLCKDRDDCPLDSKLHLRMVLKVARLQGWCYTEKSQDNQMWYYHVDKQKLAEIEELMRVDREKEKEEKRVAEEEEAQKDSKEKERKDDARDIEIQLLQQQLVHNVYKIKEFDPTYTSQLPYMEPDGSLNFSWHMEGGVAPNNEKDTV